MSYTGGNSGYWRRLGRIAGSTPPPVTPVAGYSVWFNAGASGTLFQDISGTVPVTTPLDPVLRWDSAGGSAGAVSLTHPTSRCVWSNSVPLVQPAVFGGDILTSVDKFVRTDGIISADGKAVTSFVVVYWNAAADGSAIGTNNCFWTEQRSIPEVAAYDSAAGIPKIAGNKSGQLRIVSFILNAGTGYLGVDDTRTASMGSAAFIDIIDSSLTLMGSMGGRLLTTSDYVSEALVYPTALSEANRKLTEQYLANKYSITLPY